MRYPNSIESVLQNPRNPHKTSHFCVKAVRLNRAPKQVVVDLGYCGVDADNPGVEIIHRGRYKGNDRST